MGVEMGMGIRTREAEETATTMGGIELKDWFCLEIFEF